MGLLASIGCLLQQCDCQPLLVSSFPVVQSSLQFWPVQGRGVEKAIDWICTQLFFQMSKGEGEKDAEVRVFARE